MCCGYICLGTCQILLKKQIERAVAKKNEGSITEEVVSRLAVIMHGRIGEAALLTKPSCVGVNLGVVRMMAFIALVEPAQKGEPSNTVADEEVARFMDEVEVVRRAAG